MTRILTGAVCTLLCWAAVATAQELDSDEAKQSYSVGVQLGDAIAGGKDGLNLDLVVQGLRDKLEGNELALSEEEVRSAFTTFQETMRQQQEQTRQAQGESNRKEGEAFLAENAQREGVKTTDSGLQYEILEEGDGPSPGAQDSVSTHYRGTFIDGEVFDSSYDRGQPATFPVNRVIDGWTEALQMMKVGGKWKLYIPYDLAYGPRGRAGIPPYATLIFEIELLGIEDE